MPVVKINAIEVPPDAGPELEKRFATGPAVEAHAGQRANPVATGSSLLEFEVVLDVAGTDVKA
jgi:heme-degrading monooxygenase HmoA